MKEADGTLRFVTADGRTIPRNGYRLEDFIDDELAAVQEIDEPSREGFCIEAVHDSWLPDEVREPAAVYRVGRRAGPQLSRAVGIVE